MMSVLKSVGRGILYIIGLPFFLIILVGAGILGIFILIFMFFKSIVLFFTGRSLNDELPEDRKAREIKEGKAATTTVSTGPVEVSSYIEPEIKNEEPQSIEDVVFGYNPPKEEPIEEEPVRNEDTRTSEEIFASILNTQKEADDQLEQTNINIQPE